MLQEAILDTCPSTVPICLTAPLSYSLVTGKEIVFPKLRTAKAESDKGLKVPFQRMLRERIWETCPSTVQIYITEPLS